jgi:hypothetical protein
VWFGTVNGNKRSLSSASRQEFPKCVTGSALADSHYVYVVRSQDFLQVEPAWLDAVLIPHFAHVYEFCKKVKLTP